MSAATAYRCPVCRARFRNETQCSRCGADLSRVMLLALAAQRLRNIARAALRSGDYVRARELAQIAQSQSPSPQGRNLAVLAAWLESLRRRGPRRA